MDHPVYLLDSNVFIEAKNRYYAYDLAPGFWSSLISNAAAGHIISIDRVRDELNRLKDELQVWANSHFAKWFASTNEDDTILKYGEVISWVHSQTQFLDEAKAEFADGADGWLVAFASVKGYVLSANTSITQKCANTSITRGCN